MGKFIDLGLRPGDPRDIQAAKWEIENEQTFHFKQLYKYMFEWLQEEGWSDLTLPGNENFETLYYERTLGDGNQEHHIWWRCSQPVRGSSYVRYAMKIDFQTLQMGKTEVIQKGQKFKTYKGDLILRCESYVQIDYKNEWATHWFLKHFDRAFRQRIYKKNIELMKKELYNDTYRFQKFVKHFLNLKNPHDMPESYHPKYGLGVEA
jgi:hypothetical protein